MWYELKLMIKQYFCKHEDKSYSRIDNFHITTCRHCLKQTSVSEVERPEK